MMFLLYSKKDIATTSKENANHVPNEKIDIEDHYFLLDLSIDYV
jgi:hypothetical protein